MVGQVSLQDVLPLRSKILRDGRIPPEACIWPEDRTPGGTHFGAHQNGNVVCIASVYPISLTDNLDIGYQLRGMATATGLSGKGFGSRVLEAAITYVKSRNAAYLWCNARSNATGFYLRHGFVILGTEFDIPGVGPHFKMMLRFHP